jgi:NAD(P)-dependent dehydrogenase (short-subunit alcohol dehydrogenase family)
VPITNKHHRCNAISPGEIDTAILSPGTQDIVDREIPLRRLGAVSEVSRAFPSWNRSHVD